MPSTSDIKRGVRFLYDGTPYQATDVTFQSPTARGANTLVKVRARDLLGGGTQSFSFKAGEHMEDPDIEMIKVQFLYNEEDMFHFMNTDTYEQYMVSREGLGGADIYLKEELVVRLMFFNERPISVELPKALEMKIVQTEPAIKGDTVTNVTKTAVMETGLEVQVPLFINEGDVIRVDTSEGRYVERVSIHK